MFGYKSIDFFNNYRPNKPRMRPWNACHAFQLTAAGFIGAATRSGWLALGRDWAGQASSERRPNFVRNNIIHPSPMNSANKGIKG